MKLFYFYFNFTYNDQILLYSQKLPGLKTNFKLQIETKIETSAKGSRPRPRPQRIGLETYILLKGVGRNFFSGGPIRIDLVVTTKNGRVFKFERFEGKCVKIQGLAEPPCPPLPTPMALPISLCEHYLIFCTW